MDDLDKTTNKLPTQENKSPRKKLPLIMMSLGLILLLAITGYVWQKSKDKPSITDDTIPNAVVEESKPAVEPALSTEDVVTEQSYIWDVVFPDQKTLVFTLRGGQIYGASLSTKEKWLIARPPNVWADGEGGLLGLTLDIKFSENNYAYICYNVNSPRSVRVARFKFSSDHKSANEFTEIITDIESKGGRHSGCRLVMDAQEVLWIGTGDSALPKAAQNPKSLAGKVLRVDREGKGVSGNLSDPFDNRIYSYGHRNVQGLALFDEPLANGAMGYSTEHGTGRDDEINWLLPGNFGWDPDGGSYQENAPMTDKTKFPNAISALWSSGDPTIAPSGITILKTEHWSAWQGRIVMAVLRDKHVRLVEIDKDGKLVSEKKIFENLGRVRSATEGPDGYLYLTTDNGGGQDKIIKVTPTTTF